MKIEVKEDSINYACNVVTIDKLFPIEGADRIQRTVVLGNDVVVSKNVKIGDTMLYFVSGTKLNPEFCTYNNLLDKAELNKGKVKGFISYKQFRVKAIKLKGIISNGLLMPTTSLGLWFSVSKIVSLKDGDTFTSIDDQDICEKYIVPVKPSNQHGKKSPKSLGNRVKEILLEDQFRFHRNTEHFVKHAHRFGLDTDIIITRKLHGSSLILSNVLITKKLSLKEKFFKFLGADIPTKEYGVIWSSGKPKGKLPKGVESESNKWETPNPSYYTSDIWAKAYKLIGDSVEKGISIYGEIVGQGIQGKEFTYGIEYGIYVYRITRTTIDGQVDEFSWEQIKQYCEKYGLEPVEEYYVGKVKNLPLQDFDLLGYLQSVYLNQSYPDCKFDEGICVRIRETDEIFKLKSPNFIKMESDLQEKDIEEKES